MAYKVLTDGNGGPLVHIVGMGDYIPVHMYNKLKAQVATDAARWIAVRDGSHELLHNLLVAPPQYRETIVDEVLSCEG